MRRVLFVSKPIAPPFHDGTKCIVRDLASRVRRSRATVLTTASAPKLAGAVDAEPLYPGSGSFAPAWSDNTRVLARLLTGPTLDLWHFFFAPNTVSSAAARIASRLRRVPTVQTVASAPRSFDRVRPLLFGDRVVVLSQWMHDQLTRQGVSEARLRIIPPAVAPEAPSQSEIAAVRSRLQLPDDAPVLTYPGDIEQSNGAAIVAAAIPEMLARHRDAFVVFACRKKTKRAEDAEQRLVHDLAPHAAQVRFAGELESLLPLLATSKLVLFPVDSLYGKVDLPIALLESMALGVPIIALDQGPLRELAGTVLVAPSAPRVAEAASMLLAQPEEWARLAETGKVAARTHHSPETMAAAYESVYDELVSP